MYLVDNKYGVSALFCLIDKPLHAVFELAAELCPGYHCRHVHKVYFLAAQLVGHIAGSDPLCERFRNGGFAHTRFAYKAGVVLLAAGEYLYNAFQLLFSPDNVVQLSFARALREANAEILQIARSAALLLFFRLGVTGFFLHRGVLAPEEGSEVDGGRTAVFIVAVVILRHGHKPGHALRKRVDILLTHIHLVYDIIYRLYPELLRTFDAEALACDLSALVLLNENYRRADMAA